MCSHLFVIDAYKTPYLNISPSWPIFYRLLVEESEDHLEWEFPTVFALNKKSTKKGIMDGRAQLLKGRYITLDINSLGLVLILLRKLSLAISILF